MKISTADPQFTPITIVIETAQEAAYLATLTGPVSGARLDADARDRGHRSGDHYVAHEFVSTLYRAAHAAIQP